MPWRRVAQPSSARNSPVTRARPWTGHLLFGINASWPDGDKLPRPSLLITGSHVQLSAIASREPGVCSGSLERPILNPYHRRALGVLDRAAHDSSPSHGAGGIHNGDKAWLEKAARRGLRSPSWIAPKTADVGHDVVIYIGGYGFFATARVGSRARRRRDWKRRYGAALDQIELIARQRLIEQLQELSRASRSTGNGEMP